MLLGASRIILLYLRLFLTVLTIANMVKFQNNVKSIYRTSTTLQISL